MNKILMRRIYLDYAASTPMAPEVKKAMEPYFGYLSNKGFGNPGSLHFFGQEAMAAVDKSREIIAKAIGADFREIIFTGSATEANNLVLRGSLAELRRQDAKLRRQDAKPRGNRIIISAIEHPSILETARDLEKEGTEVIYIPVDKNGIVELKKIKKALNERTILVSIMYANNEIGTIEPIKEIAEIIQRFKATNASESPKNIIQRSESPKNIFVNSDKFVVWDRYPLFHTDAVQAFQYLNCQVSDLKVDLMTLSAHKIYGPKGIGVLYVKEQNNILPFIVPIITGGGQEFGLRSGTENVPLIVGFSEAVKIISHSRPKEIKRMNQLSQYFWKEIKKIFPKAEINGIEPGRDKRLPNICNIFFPGYSAEELLIKLDLNGLAVSTGSACSARAFKPSEVLRALGLSQSRIKNSLRFSFGKFLTMSDIKEALKKIKAVL
ncbi:cysteine desulfurase NifS [Candidatus Jorgensenbacteria bacterium CG03_land_8_20_14_0_80_38_39]|nr:MAG: cysteine desulfurase NifS [Candidatus Jorgensenbacteria bacterium CG03_land_8_20_14_0_80_38_39]PJA95249.1 MAG: cysteine desulfurase NifS [Candidatus Jorgensenbacteria bacterium CG_4_9_14_3_um_filter_38_10]